MTFRFWPLMLAFRLKIPEEFRVKVVILPPAFRMSAPLAIVRLPAPFCVQPPRLGQAVVLAFTSIVTLLLLSAAEMTLAAVLSIVRSIGSRSQVPALPILLFAAVFTLTVGASATVPLELVSTKPPLPESVPPVDFRIPPTVVLISDQIAIVPPLPALVADVSMTASFSTVTVLAICLALDAAWALALIVASACLLVCALGF